MTNLKEKAGINVGINMGKFQGSRIVMETTGCYETDIAAAAFERGLSACVINSIQIHKIARASNQYAKIDKPNAQTIASFAT